MYNFVNSKHKFKYVFIQNNIVHGFIIYILNMVLKKFLIKLETSQLLLNEFLRWTSYFNTQNILDDRI